MVIFIITIIVFLIIIIIIIMKIVMDWDNNPLKVGRYPESGLLSDLDNWSCLGHSLELGLVVNYYQRGQLINPSLPLKGLFAKCSIAQISFFFNIMGGVWAHFVQRVSPAPFLEVVYYWAPVLHCGICGQFACTDKYILIRWPRHFSH